MVYFFLGITAFLFFIIYDVNMIILKLKLFNSFFFLGFLFLMIATGGIIFESQYFIKGDVLRMIIFGIPTIIFFILLMYTLFFALPFRKTYIKADESKDVCQKGVYALCRHPGVLWFNGFYLFLWLTFGSSFLFWAGLTFSFSNLIYVIFQDRWTFMKKFKDYQEYKEKTPFIIPNCMSIKHCLKTL